MKKSMFPMKKALAVFLVFTIIISSLSGCTKAKTEQQSEALVALENAVNYYKTTNKLTHWEELVALCAANQADGIGIGWSFLTLPETPAVNEYPSSYTGAILSDTIKGEGDPVALAKQLAALQNPDTGSFNDSYLNQHVWAMISLNTAISTDGYDYAKAVEYLLSFQAKDGGFAYRQNGKEGNVDLTGIACVALAPYYQEHKKDKGIKKIVEFLKQKQTVSGGFTNSNQEENPSSTAMAIWGLSALNQPLPATDKGATPFDALIAYQNEDGSFRTKLDGDQKADSAATREATIALCDIVNDINTYVLLASDAENYRIEHLSGPSVTLMVNYPEESGLKDISGPFTVEEGSSVLDALILYGKITETPVSHESGFIKSINNVKEKDYGPLSCWLYTLNGQELSENPKTILVQEGDVLAWTYYVDPAWVAEQQRIAAEEAAKAQAEAQAAAEEARAAAEAKATEQN